MQTREFKRIEMSSYDLELAIRAYAETKSIELPEDFEIEVRTVPNSAFQTAKRYFIFIYPTAIKEFERTGV